ncbi:MAG TPA: sigma factor [Candidatus Angelobacter sp.]|jgi:RNA polymerase sigma factor for flagellar operon FliA|nr:sigma factor [Candidatus Angelobacter sp.]
MSTNVVNSTPPELVVQNYFNLVGTIAARIKHRMPSHIDVQDLVQTGLIGLMEASEPAVELSTYANSQITGAILVEMRRWETFSHQDRKNRRNDEEPDQKQIAEAVGLGLEEYDRTLGRMAGSPRRVSSARTSTMIQ